MKDKSVVKPTIAWAVLSIGVAWFLKPHLANWTSGLDTLVPGLLGVALSLRLVDRMPTETPSQRALRRFAIHCAGLAAFLAAFVLATIFHYGSGAQGFAAVIMPLILVSIFCVTLSSWRKCGRERGSS